MRSGMCIHVDRLAAALQNRLQNHSTLHTDTLNVGRRTSFISPVMRYRPARELLLMLLRRLP